MCLDFSSTSLSKHSSDSLLHRAVSIWPLILKYFDWRTSQYGDVPVYNVAFTAGYFCSVTSERSLSAKWAATSVSTAFVLILSVPFSCNSVDIITIIINISSNVPSNVLGAVGKRIAWTERNVTKNDWAELAEVTLICDQEVSYCKQIAHQHSSGSNVERT